MSVAIARAKEKWILQRLDALNSTATSTKGTKICWDTIKSLKNGLKKPNPVKEKMMTKPDGTKCKSSEENADVFRNHFDKLYNREPTFDPEVLDSIDQHPVLTECQNRPNDIDIKKALLRLKNKAPGDTGITPLMLKACIHDERYFKLLPISFLKFGIMKGPLPLGILDF